MILHHYGKSLVGHVIRWPLWDGPGAQYAIHFESEIEVQPPRRMLVDDEQPALFLPGDGRPGARRLGRTLQRPLGAVRGERIGFGIRHARKLSPLRAWRGPGI
jgi:hypothetical protein